MLRQARVEILEVTEETFIWKTTKDSVFMTAIASQESMCTRKFKSSLIVAECGWHPGCLTVTG